MDTSIAPPNLPAPRNESELVQQVGEWADRNFKDNRAPDYGIVEEVGEAVHCVLKKFQGIRGFEDHAFFLEKFGDCLADAMIYLADWSYLHNAIFRFGRNQHQLGNMTMDDERRIILHMLQGSASMLSFGPIYRAGTKIEAAEEGVYNMLAQRICTGVEYWANLYQIDIRWLVTATWQKVRQRDWVKNPATAGN